MWMEINLLFKCFWRHYYKMWVQFISFHSLDWWIHYFFTGPHSLDWWCHYFFIGPHSLDQWFHCFFTGPHSLQLMNSLKIQWKHLVYKDTFCYNERKWTVDWSKQRGKNPQEKKQIFLEGQSQKHLCERFFPKGKMCHKKNLLRFSVF
jgi:hypothetical protein